jgi:hypothetical protein
MLTRSRSEVATAFRSSRGPLVLSERFASGGDLKECLMSAHAHAHDPRRGQIFTGPLPAQPSDNSMGKRRDKYGGQTAETALGNARSDFRGRPVLQLVSTGDTDILSSSVAFDRCEKARSRPLRFFVRHDAERMRACRISGIFEAEPEVDHIVIGIIRNGYQSAGDLHGAAVADVFAEVDATLSDQRAVIEALKGNLGLTVAY